jgi:hypothetical protein
MPRLTCDPSPDAHYVTTLSKGNGTVTVTIRSDWDGVSTPPNCTGPLFDARLQNTGTNTWILKLPNGRLAKNRPITPGTDQTFNATQLANIGLVTIEDIENLTLVLAP